MKDSDMKGKTKTIEDYTDEELRRAGKNWAKVQGVRVKGIQNLSRKGLLSLFKKEKVSMDFLKFKIIKKPQYTSTLSGTKKVSSAPGNDGGWAIDRLDKY